MRCGSGRTNDTYTDERLGVDACEHAQITIHRVPFLDLETGGTKAWSERNLSWGKCLTNKLKEQ